jgi:HTH-type transcriptional regulator / antitoxin HigA
MAFDRERYRALVADALPVVIDNEEEYDRLMTRAEELMEKGDGLAIEERRLLELLIFLIEAHHRIENLETGEEEVAPDELPAPHVTLGRLLEARGLEPRDIEHVFGNPHAAREALEGRREITSGQARQLAKFFDVPPKLFVRK